MKKIILIAEDNPVNLKLVRDILQVSGYVTLEATNGRQATEFARLYSPHMILMDIRMPVMDGFEATKILKADPKTRNIPVIALTSFAMKGDEEKIYEAGCDGYLTKPLDTRKFLKKVAEYLKPDSAILKSSALV
ncbi:response regulator [Desulfonema magnum]|uniref:Two component system response regulator n=1 Tax=Desulfonema magnum TaxID=45655 RepID=A0A975BWL9_9BACT|nr:response regulator [Desulfonema magnum]QTA93121.1 Two component system response regulator [Desulfonema magnum]